MSERKLVTAVGVVASRGWFLAGCLALGAGLLSPGAYGATRSTVCSTADGKVQLVDRDGAGHVVITYQPPSRLLGERTFTYQLANMSVQSLSRSVLAEQVLPNVCQHQDRFVLRTRQTATREEFSIRRASRYWFPLGTVGLVPNDRSEVRVTMDCRTEVSELESCWGGGETRGARP